MGKRFLIILFPVAALACCAAATGGSIICSFESPCSDRTDGIDFRGGYIYHANCYGPADILKTCTGGSVMSSWNEPAHAVGLDFTGSEFWVYAFWPNVPRDRIFRLSEGGSVVASFAAPANGRGITYDGERLWYSTAGNHNWNYVYELTTTASVLSSFQAPHGRGYLNKGLDWGGEYLWLAQASDADGLLYQMTTAGSVVYSISVPGRRPTGV
ncbi:MAG: hypothetical protein GTN49_12345, partial [candidate division Zixibacteria bacterium]|nr:hypothetical protein [candidate division Zixibacteria bacterium]